LFWSEAIGEAIGTDLTDADLTEADRKLPT
jgi:hypothetical protein